MKFPVPLTLALLLTACAAPTPEDKEAAHQQELEKEARENFYSLRSQLGTHPVPPPEATPAPKRGLFASTDAGSPPAAAPDSPKRKPRPAPPNNNGTVYYWQVPAQQAETAPRYTRAELRYARQLAKSPEDLTPDERLWAREHY